MGNNISITYINHYKNKKETIQISFSHQLSCLELTQKILEEIKLKYHLTWKIEDIDILVKDEENQHYQIIEKNDRTDTLMKWKFLRIYHKGTIYDFVVKYPFNYF
jgi:uncharacterized protein (UPF0248 family)